MRKAVKQLVADLARDLMSLGHRQPTGYGHVHFSVDAVSDPPGPHVRDFFDARRVAGGMCDGLQDLRIHAVQHTDDDRPSGLQDEDENCGRNREADQRISERVAEPDAGGTNEDRQARPPINARVVAIGNERGAPDLPSDADAEQPLSFDTMDGSTIPCEWPWPPCSWS
jgi:hypothetical protein